ncbi:aromatic acid exporter family protein [Amycolatopsis sp. NBC_00355]|uniref:FUSC family protein n=1 Tax=Amycolatopsis sp. NBC_00355 TaxID=2975957 RepID=UPI002E252B69
MDQTTSAAGDDILGQGVRTPLGWLTRAFRVPGRERHVLVQAAKATLAATGAWLLATAVLHLPQPFLAPYAAVFLVETTVYRSVRGWAQQVGAVAAGVVLAGIAGQLIPWPAVALGLVVFLGLLAGSWRRFGDSGVWVGVTGMLLIAYGTPTVLLGDRLIETALGAAIGAAVNALVYPPLFGQRIAAAAGRLAEAMAAFLAGTAALIRAAEPPGDVEDWLGEARELRSLVTAAADAVRRTQEERVLNLRRRHPRSGHDHDRRTETLISLWPPVEQLIGAVRTASEHEETFVLPWPDARDALAELIESLADVVRAVGTTGHPVDLDRGRELLAHLERRLAAPEDGVTPALGLGAMTLPVRHLLERLAGR